MLNILDAVHKTPNIFQNEDFFLRINLPSTRKRRFRAPITQVFLQFPDWRFLTTPASRLRVDGRKRRFSNTMMPYIIYPIALRKLCNVRDVNIFPSF